MLDFCIFSKILVPVRITYFEVEETENSFSNFRYDDYFLLEEPCNPLLNFFGLSRFDKNAKNFKARYIITYSKEEFLHECIKYSRMGNRHL